MRIVVMCIIVALMGTPATAWAYSWGFPKSQNGIAPSLTREPFAHVLDKTVYVGHTDPATLYLTFDNGYEAGYTRRILDTLRKKRVPALFFVTGQFVRDQPMLLQRITNEGHTLGNHSWSHPDMTTRGAQAQKEEYERLRSAVAAVTGKNEMLFVRPPRGLFTENVLDTAIEAGYVPVFWSVAYKDWLIDDQRGADIAHLQIMSQLHPGAIILLHAVSRDNCDALERIIDDARARGYRFGALTDVFFSGPS
jgi:peptidoglycan-N-acetylmuramic acid deacetylase